YNHNTPSSKILDTLNHWLNLPNYDRPHLITLYFHEVDGTGHRFGPNTPETNISIKKVDSTIGKLIQLISNSSLRDSINIIIVSDHGMTSINKEKNIFIETPIKQQHYSIQYNPTMCFIKPDKKEDLKIIYDSLKQHERNYHVYLKSQIPDSFHFQNNEFIYDIITIPDLGYSFVRDTLDIQRIKGGNHGYPNNHKDMHGIFIAQGNLFKKKYTVGKIKNIDIYPFLCYLFNVNPNPKVDGKLSPDLLSTLQ
ncbi:MAG: alkaline phosphatase family protein, partial [Chitinophagaceae bacterium]